MAKKRMAEKKQLGKVLMDGQEDALVEMVLKGASHRRAEDVLAVMGVKEISPTQISRFLGRLDEHVEAFRMAPIDGEYPYVYLDAKLEKARVKGLPTQQAVLIAIGMRKDGRRGR